MFTQEENAKIMDDWKQTGLPTVVRITSSHESRTWRDNTHMHDKEVELHLVKQGSTSLTVHNQTFVVSEGDIIVIPAGLLHLVRSDVPVYLYTCRLYLPQLMEPIIPLNICPIAPAGNYFSIILKTMESLVELSELGIADHSCLCNMLGGILACIYRKIFAASQIPFSPPKQNLALNVLHYINEHYSENVTLSLLAKNFYVSASYISNEFKKEFNISPINYLINRRICEAKWYLINTREPIAEISHKVGYGNAYHFTKLFMKRTDISPEKFREMHRII